MKTKELAAEILTLIGGESNISQLTHCATRLRIMLKDDSKADIKKIDVLEGVLKAQNKGGQLQVVIGAKVQAVFDDLSSMVSLDENAVFEKKKEKNPFNAVVETIAGIFTPLLPAMIGCGMIKSLTILMTTLNLVDPTAGFMTIFTMIGDSVFYFFPFFIAVSAAKKFKVNEYLAVALAACLMHPTIMNGAMAIATTGVDTISFLGPPVLLAKYSNTIIPIIFSVWILSYVYRFVDKYIPDFLKVILTPMIVLFIMVPLELIVIGPFGSYAGEVIAMLIHQGFEMGGIFAAFLLGFFRPILVMFGMHYTIQPIMLQQIAEIGYTNLLPSSLAANMAQAGAAFGVFLVVRDVKMKSAAGSSAISGIFGITEPAIYGVNLKYKRPFFIGCFSAGICSALYMLINTTAVAMVLPNILSIGIFQGNSFILIVLLTILAFVLPAILVVFFGGIRASEAIVTENMNEKTITGTITIESPMAGEVKPLSEVNDKVFSQQLIGKGIAIEPSEGKVFAPFDGKVEMLFKTHHAIGLKSEAGVEVLIHVGLDTVNLEGKGYTAHVEQGQSIKKGDLLLEFDIASIKEAGYDLITPVIITNAGEYVDVIANKLTQVKTQDILLNVFK